MQGFHQKRHQSRPPPQLTHQVLDIPGVRLCEGREERAGGRLALVWGAADVRRCPLASPPTFGWKMLNQAFYASLHRPS